MTHRRQLLAASAIAATLPAWLARPVRAQSPLPSRPVTLMVPWPAGAPSDAIARKLQPGWQQALGQPVLVDNLGGAGGTLGVARALQQPADGHTVLVATPTELVLSPQTLPAVRYRAEDFLMLAQFGKVPYVLCCRSDLPQATLADVVSLAGRGGKPPSMGHIGAGSLIHLIGLSFEKASGLAVTHVPYRGVPPMLQDLMAGQIDLAFLPLAGSLVATIEQGRIRPLGITAPRPSPLFPKLPTLAAGHPRFERFEFDAWGGLFVRRETPQPVQDSLHRLWAQTVRDTEFVAWMRATGSEPQPVLSLAEAQAFYTRETARYTALLREFPDAVNR